MFKTLHNLHYEQIGKEVRCIEDELPFEIPDSWVWCKLDSICSKLVDGDHNPPKGTSNQTNYLMCSSTNINDDKLTNLEKVRYLTKEVFNKENERTKCKEGDIFFTSVGSLGRSCIYKGNLNICFQRSVSVITTLVFNQFLKYYFDNPYFQNKVNKEATGTAQKGFYLNQLATSLIAIPPLNEQYRIVNKLKQLEPLIDKYKQAEEKLFELNSNIKEQLKKSILQYAIEGKLVPQDPNDEPASVLLERIHKEKEKLIADGKIKKDKNESVIYRRDNSYYEKLNNNEKCIDDQITFEIPDNWCWARLGSIGDWKAGTTPSKSNTEYYKNGSIPWLLTGDLNDGLIQEIPNKITEKAMNETSMKLNPSGSILIAMYGATIGKLGILPLPAATNQACCACNVIHPFYNLYLFYFLMANKTNFVKQGEGGAQPNISREKITKTLIPIPPANEQHNIVSKIERINSILANL